MIHSQKYNGKQRDEAQASNHHLQTRNEKQLLEMLQKWILHFHLLKFLHQKWLLEKRMSHQITGLITRTSVLLPELCCLGLLCQQSWVMCSLSRVPSAPHEVTIQQPAQPLAARRDTYQASPVPMEQSLLPWAPGCAGWYERPPGTGQPLKDTASCQLPASFKGRLVLRSTAAGISSALPWQGSPCSVERQKVPRGGPAPPWSPVSFSPNSSIKCS